MNTKAQTPDLSSIEQYAWDQVNTRQFAGIAWSVEYKGSVLSAGEAGFSDHAMSRTLQPDTLYRIYSMTKPLVSLLCLMLIDAGKFRLSDSASRWIPELAELQVCTREGSMEPLVRPITVADLLTHRAGFSYDFLPDCAVAKRYRASSLIENGAISLDELILAVCKEPLAMQPGERWYYSYATDVLACLLQRVSGMSIADLLAKNLFEPLEMSDTAFHVANDKRFRVSDMFGQSSLGQVTDPALTSNQLQAMSVEHSYPLADQQFMRGGLGLYSSIPDYCKFIRLLFDGHTQQGKQLLSATVLDMIWSNYLEVHQIPIAIGSRSYPGYGWSLAGRIMVDESVAENQSANGEGGWSGAASTHFWADRRNQFAGIVMAQYLGSGIALGSDIQSLAYTAMNPVFVNH